MFLKVKVWFQNRRMKSKKLQSRAPTLNNGGTKQETSSADDGGGTDIQGENCSRSGCPSTASSMDSSTAPLHQQQHNIPPQAYQAYGNAFVSQFQSMKMNVMAHAQQQQQQQQQQTQVKSPGQASDSKDEGPEPEAHSFNEVPLQKSPLNPFDGKPISSESMCRGFEVDSRFDLSQAPPYGHQQQTQQQFPPLIHPSSIGGFPQQLLHHRDVPKSD